MANTQQQPFGLSQMLTIFVLILAMFILFDQNLRNGLGAALGFVLEPVVGFGGQYPVVSLFLTGMIMTGITIILRHFFTDYVEQVKSQKIVAAFNKELREARLDNNTYKIKKLTEMQQEIMQKSMKVSTQQLKLLPMSMIVIIPIFAWVSVFIGNLSSSLIAVPWSMNVNLNDSILLPVWILLYSLISIPFGQILMRTLRYFEFRKRLHELEAGEP
jgi:uncharacterized membrane protein (DUF106 family)